MRTYDELVTLPTFEERFRYLRIGGLVGKDTFGGNRWINQLLYSSPEWSEIRDEVIIRDLGCDLGMVDREIMDIIHVHHMNPITKEDIIYRREIVLSPRFLITTSDTTHRAIHYGDENLLVRLPPERKPFDTCPWRKGG